MAEIGPAAPTFTPRAWAPPSWPLGTRPRPRLIPQDQAPGELTGSVVHPPPTCLSRPPGGTSPLEAVGGSGGQCLPGQHFDRRDLIPLSNHVGLQAPHFSEGKLRLPQRGSICLGAGPRSCCPAVWPEPRSPPAKGPLPCTEVSRLVFILPLEPGCGLGCRAVSGRLQQVCGWSPSRT